VARVAETRSWRAKVKPGRRGVRLLSDRRASARRRSALQASRTATARPSRRHIAVFLTRAALRQRRPTRNSATLAATTSVRSVVEKSGRESERQQASPRQSAIIRAADGCADGEIHDPLCPIGNDNLPLLLPPLLLLLLAYVVNLIARRTQRDTRARSRTSSATVCFLHASCRDYLADQRIVHARRIRGRIG